MTVMQMQGLHHDRLAQAVASQEQVMLCHSLSCIASATSKAMPGSGGSRALC